MAIDPPYRIDPFQNLVNVQWRPRKSLYFSLECTTEHTSRVDYVTGWTYDGPCCGLADTAGQCIDVGWLVGMGYPAWPTGSSTNEYLTDVHFSGGGITSWYGEHWETTGFPDVPDDLTLEEDDGWQAPFLRQEGGYWTGAPLIAAFLTTGSTGSNVLDREGNPISVAGPGRGPPYWKTGLSVPVSLRGWPLSNWAYYCTDEPSRHRDWMCANYSGCIDGGSNWHHHEGSAEGRWDSSYPPWDMTNEEITDQWPDGTSDIWSSTLDFSEVRVIKKATETNPAQEWWPVGTYCRDGRVQEYYEWGGKIPKSGCSISILLERHIEGE